MKIHNLNNEIDTLIADQIDEVIRHGEFDPSPRVLDDVVHLMGKTWGSYNLFYNTLDGDEQFADYFVSGDFDKADTRFRNLARQWAEMQMRSREHVAWELWELRRMPQGQ